MIRLMDVCTYGYYDSEETMTGIIVAIEKSDYGKVYFMKSPIEDVGGWFSSGELRKANKAERKALANAIMEHNTTIW